MIQPDMFLDPDLSGMPSMFSVDLTTFTGDAVNTNCLQAKVILDGEKETGNLPKQETTLLSATFS
jgi:hypothetical protein